VPKFSQHKLPRLVAVILALPENHDGLPRG